MAKRIAKQMELFEPVERGFEEGGLMDEGGTVDPISGNDVPVGSTQEEVRDDIPAQLSEGEFVLPADVVRYHGLDKIMALRDEAKAGLAKMEAMGQMGNSEEATIPDDVPFDIEDLDIEDEGEYNDSELNFAVGGAVPMQGFTGIGGYQPAPVPTTGFAPAPSVAAPVQAASAQPTQAGTFQPAGTQFTPTTVAPVMPTFQQTIGAGVIGVDYEMVDYINEAGQVIQLRKNKATGEMLDPIPEGYKLKSEKVESAVTTPTTVGTATTRDEGNDTDEDVTTGATVSFGGTKATGKRAGLVDNAFSGNLSFTGVSPSGISGFLGSGVSSFAEAISGGKFGEALSLSGEQGAVISNIKDPSTKVGVSPANTLGFNLAFNADQYNKYISRSGPVKVTDRQELADIVTQLSKIDDVLSGETLSMERASYLAESIKMGREDEIRDSIEKSKDFDAQLSEALGRDRGKVSGSGIFGTNIGGRDRTGAISAAERAEMSAAEKVRADKAVASYVASMDTSDDEDDGYSTDNVGNYSQDDVVGPGEEYEDDFEVDMSTSKSESSDDPGDTGCFITTAIVEKKGETDAYTTYKSMVSTLKEKWLV
jgi:hypothetical protein